MQSSRHAGRIERAQARSSTAISAPLGAEKTANSTPTPAETSITSQGASTSTRMAPGRPRRDVPLPALVPRGSNRGLDDPRSDDEGVVQYDAPSTQVGGSSSSSGPAAAAPVVAVPTPMIEDRQVAPKRSAEATSTDTEGFDRGLPFQRSDGDPVLVISLLYEVVAGIPNHAVEGDDVQEYICAYDFAELFNPGVFQREAKPFRLSCGGVYDLQSDWNLSLADHRAACWRDLEEKDPYLIIGAPWCGPFCRWQQMPANQASPAFPAKYREALMHLHFCIKVYLWQHRRGKKFLHEHPWSASSWSVPAMVELMSIPGIERRLGHQCRFNQRCRDSDDVEKLVLKPTGWLSDCSEILDCIALTCSNLGRPSHEHHAHCQLQGGRAKAMERYTPSMCRAILQGLVNHYKNARLRPVDNLSNVHSLAYRSLENLEVGPTLDEPQVDYTLSVPDVDEKAVQSQQKYYDDVTGFELCPKRVHSARMEELKFLDKLGVWKIVDRNEAMSMTGYRPIGVRWVNTNKGDHINPEVRCRLVVQETKRVSGHLSPGDVFSATPPLECLRILCSLAMTLPANRTNDPDNDIVLTFLDISRAHPHCPVKRHVYVELPKEHPASSNPTSCALLLRTLYGCRDAGSNFELFVYDICRNGGCLRGETNPCVYRHAEKQCKFFHHGDDFVILGPRKNNSWVKALLSEHLEVKDRGSLGPGENDLREIDILHRTIVWHLPSSSEGERITYCADPRHAEILRTQCGLNAPRTKGVVTPGEKVPVTPEKLEELPEADVAGFQSGAMRAGYLSLDRPDIMFCAKECARGLSCPTVRHGDILRRLVRYLISHPNLHWVYRRQRFPKEIVVWSDTDWAGCPITRRSTSGTAVTFGSHTWLCLSSTQVPISLSSAEAEFYGIVKAGSRGIGIYNLCRDFGVLDAGSLALRINSDSSSAIAVASKRGVGKIRHLETGALWIQAAIATRRLSLTKVPGKSNLPDILTKAVDRDTLHRMLKGMGLVVSQTRSSALPSSLASE